MRSRNRTGILFILGVVYFLSSVRNEDEIAEKTKLKRREFVKIKTVSKHSKNNERTDNIHSTESFLQFPLNQSVDDQLQRDSFLRHEVLHPDDRNNKYFKKQPFLEKFNEQLFQDEKFPVRRNEIIENTFKNLKNILHTKKEAIFADVPLYSKRGLKEQNLYKKAVEYLKNGDGEENEKDYEKYTNNYLIEKGNSKLNINTSTKNTISFPTQQKRDFPAHDSETDIGLDEKSLRMFAGEDDNNAIDESYSSSTASEILGTMASIFEVAEKSSAAERNEAKNLKKNTIPLLNNYKDVSDDEAYKVPNEDFNGINFDNKFADVLNENTKRRRERRNTVVDVEEIPEPSISNTSTPLTYGSEDDYPTHLVEGEVFKYEIKNSYTMKTLNKTSAEKAVELKNEIKSPTDYHLSHQVLPQLTGMLDVESVSVNPNENGIRRHFLLNHGAEKLHNSFKRVASNNSKTMFTKNPNKQRNFKVIVNENLSHSGEVLQNSQNPGKDSNAFLKKLSSNNHSFKENELKLYDQSKIEGFIGTRDEIDQFNHYAAFNLKVENDLHNKNEFTALTSGNSYSSASQTNHNGISEMGISGDQNQIVKGEDGNGDDEQKSDFYNQNEYSQHRKIIWKQMPVNLVELNKANKKKNKEGKIEWRWTPYYWDCDGEGSGCKLKPLQTSDGKVPKLKKLESGKSSSGKSSSGKSSSGKSSSSKSSSGKSSSSKSSSSKSSSGKSSSGKSSSGKSSSGKSSSGKSSSGKSSSGKSSSSKSSSGKSSSGMTNGKSKNKDNTQIFKTGNYGLNDNKKDTGKNTNLNDPSNPKPQQPNQMPVNPNAQNGPYNSSQPPYNPNQQLPNNQQPFPNQAPQPQPKRKKTKKIPISTKHPSQTFQLNSETDKEAINANLNSTMAKYLHTQKKQIKTNKNKDFSNKMGGTIDLNKSLHKSSTEKGKLRETTLSINTRENVQIENEPAVKEKNGPQTKKTNKKIQLDQDFRTAKELLKSEKLQDIIKNTTKKEKVAVKLEYDKGHNTWTAKEPRNVMGKQAHKNNTKKGSDSVILVFDKKQGTWTAKIPNKNKKEESINENNIKKEKVGVVIDYDKKLGTWVAKEPEISKKMKYEKNRKTGVTLQYDKVFGTWVAKEPVNLEKINLDKNSTSKKQKVAVHLKFNKKQHTWIAKEPPKVNKENNIHKNNTKKEKVAVSLEFDKNHSVWTAREPLKLKYTKKQLYNNSIKYEKKVNKTFVKKNNSHSPKSFVTKQFMEMISNYTKKSKDPKRNMTAMNIRSEHKSKAETNKMPIMQLQWNNKEKTWVSKEINKTNHFLQTIKKNTNTKNIQQNINGFPLSKSNFMEKKVKKNRTVNFVKSKTQVKKIKTKPHKSTLSRSRRDNTIFYLVKHQPISSIIQNQEFEKRSQKQSKSTNPMTNYGEIGVPKSRRKRIKMIMTRKRKFAPEFDDLESHLSLSSPKDDGDDFEEISGSGLENISEKKLRNTEKQSHIKNISDEWNDLINNASKKSSFHLHDKSYFPKQMVLESVRQRPRNKYSSKRSSDISSYDNKHADSSLIENDDDSLSGFIIEDDGSDTKDSVQSHPNDKYSRNMNLIWDDYNSKPLNNIEKEIFFQSVPISDEYKKEKKENTGYKGIFLPDDTANVHFANPTSTATKRNPISFVNVFEKTRMYRNNSCCRMSQLDEDWEFNCCGNQNDQIDLSCCEESVEYPDDSRTTKVTWGNLGEIHRNGKNEDSGKDLMELASGFKLKSSEGTVNLGKLLNTLTNNETLLSQQKKPSGKQKHPKEHHFSNEKEKEEEVTKATSKLESGVKHTLVHPTKTPTDLNNVQQTHKPYPYVFYPTPKSSYPTFVYPAKQVNQLPQVIRPSPQIVFGNSYNDQTIPWKTYSTNLVVIPLTTRKSHKGPLRIVWGQSYHINTTSKPHTTKAINGSEHTTKRKPHRTTTTVRSANSNIENYEQDITYKMEENLNKSHNQPNLNVNTELNKKKKQYPIEVGHKVKPSYSNQSGDKSNQHIPVVTRPKMPVVYINKGSNAKQQHKTNMSDHFKQQHNGNLSYNLKQQYPLYAGYQLQPKVQPVTKLQPNVRPPISNYGNTSNSTVYFYPIHHNNSNNISKPYRWPYRPVSTLKTENNKEESSGDIEEAIKFESVLINNKKEEKINSSKKVKSDKATQESTKDTENHKTNKVKRKPKVKSTEKGKTAVVAVQENVTSPTKITKEKNRSKSKRKNQEEMKEKAKPKLKDKAANLSTTNKHYTTHSPLNKNYTTMEVPKESGTESKPWLPEVKKTMQNDLLSTTPFTFQTKNTTITMTTTIYTTPIYNLNSNGIKKPAIPTKTSNQQYQPANQPYTYNISQSTYSLSTQPPPTIRFTSKSYKILCLPIEWPCYGQRFAQTKMPLSSYTIGSNQTVKNNMSTIMQPISICGEGMAMPCVKVPSSLTPSVPIVNLQANNIVYSPTSSQKIINQPQKTVPSRIPLTIADLMFPTQTSLKYGTTAQSTNNSQYSQNNTETGSGNASFVMPVYQPILPIIIGSPCGTVFNPCVTQNVLPCIPRPNFPCPIESVNAIEVPVQVNQLPAETTTTLLPQAVSPSQEPELIASIATPNFGIPKTTSITPLNPNDTQNEAQNSGYKENPLETELTQAIHGGEKQPNVIPVVPLVPCPTALNTLCANDLRPIIPNQIPVWGVETVETIIKQVPATVTPKFNQMPKYKYKPSIKQQSYEDVGVELYGKNINGPSIGHPANESQENIFEDKPQGFPEFSAQVSVNATEQVSVLNNFTYHYGNSPTSKAATSTLPLSSDSLSLNTARVEVSRAKEVDENRYSSPIQEKYVKKPKVAKTTPTTTQSTTITSTSQFTTTSLTNQPTTTTSTSQSTTASSSSQPTTTLTESTASSTSVLTKSTTDQNDSPKTIERPYTWVYDKVSQQWNYVQSSQDTAPGDILSLSKSTTNKSIYNNELIITSTPSSEVLTTEVQETIFYASTSPTTTTIPPLEENYNISYQQQSSNSQEMYLMTTSTPPQDYTTQPPSDTTSTSTVSTEEPETTAAVLETSTNYMSSKNVSPVETSTVTAAPSVESTVSSTEKKLKIQKQDSEFVYYESTVAPSTDKSSPNGNDDDDEPDYELINPQKNNKTNSNLRPTPPGPQKSDSWLSETQNNVSTSKSNSSTNDTAIKVILGDRLSAGYFPPATILNQTSPEDLSNYISAGLPNTSLSLISQGEPENAAVPYLSDRHDVSYGVEYVNEENFLPAELNSSSLYRINAMQQPEKAVEIDNTTTTNSPKPTKKPTGSKLDEYTFKDKNKKEDNLLNLIPESTKQPKTTVSTSTSFSTEEIIPEPDVKPNVTDLESLPSKEDSSSTLVENSSNRLRSTTVQTTAKPLSFSETTAMKIPIDIDRPSIYAALENKHIETTSTPKTTVSSTTITAEIKTEPLIYKLAEEKTTPSKVIETAAVTPTLITNEVKTDSITYKVFKETSTPKTTVTSTTVTNEIETEPLTYKLAEEKTTPPKLVETTGTIAQVSSSAIASNENQVFTGLKQPSYNQFLESIYGFDSYEEYLKNYTASINTFHITPAPEVTSTSQMYNTEVHETLNETNTPWQVFTTSQSTYLASINNPVANLSAALQNVEPDSENEDDGGADNEEGISNILKSSPKTTYKESADVSTVSTIPSLVNCVSMGLLNSCGSSEILSPYSISTTIALPTVSTSTLEATKSTPSEELAYSNVNVITTTVTPYLSLIKTTVSVAAEAYTTHSTPLEISEENLKESTTNIQLPPAKMKMSKNYQAEVNILLSKENELETTKLPETTELPEPMSTKSTESPESTESIDTTEGIISTETTKLPETTILQVYTTSTTTTTSPEVPLSSGTIAPSKVTTSSESTIQPKTKSTSEETPSPQRTKSLETMKSIQTTVNSLYEVTDVASYNETDNETIGILFSDTANVPQDPQLLETLTTITPYQVHTTRTKSSLKTSYLSSTPETSTVYSTMDTSTMTNAYNTSAYPIFSSTALETKSYPETTPSTFSLESSTITSTTEGYQVYLSTTIIPLNVNDNIFQNTTTLSPYTKSFPTSYPYSSNQSKTFTVNIPVMKTEEVKKEENTEDGGLFNEMNINKTLDMHKPTSTTPKKKIKANSSSNENYKEEKPLAVLTSPSPKNKTTTVTYPYFTQKESYESLSKDDKRIQVDNSLFNNLESRNFQNIEQLPESGNKDKYNGFASYADYLFDYYNKISASQKAEPTTLQNLYSQKDYVDQNESKLLADSTKYDQTLQSPSSDHNQLFITEKIVLSNESQFKNEALITDTVIVPTLATHVELSSYDIALKDYYKRIQESQPSRIQNSIQPSPFKPNNTEYETYKTFPFENKTNEIFYEKQNDSLKKPSEIISSLKDSEMKFDTWKTSQTPASSSVSLKESLNSSDTIGSLFLEKPLLIEPSQDLKSANDITVTEILDLLYPTQSPNQSGKTSILKSSATDSSPRVTSSENTPSFHGYQSYEAYLEALIKANSAVPEDDETEEESTVTSNISYELPKINTAYASTNESVQSITDDSLKQTTMAPMKNLNSAYSSNDDSINSLLVQKISLAESPYQTLLSSATPTPVPYTELSQYQRSTSTTPNMLVFGFSSYDEYLADYYRKLQIGYSSQISDQVVKNTSAFNEDYIKNNESSSYKILPLVQNLQSEQVLPSTRFEENQEIEGPKNQKSLNTAEQDNSGRFNGFASYEEYRIDYYKKLQSWYVPSNSEVPTIAAPFIQGKVENNSSTNQASELKDESIATATDFTIKVKNELDKETFYHAASDKSIETSDEIQAASETSFLSLNEKKSTIAPIIVTMQKEIESTTKHLSTTPRGLLTETATTESYTLPVNVNDTTVPTASSSKLDSTTDSSIKTVTTSERSTSTDFSYPNANLDSNSIKNKTPTDDSIQTDAPTTSVSSTTNVSPNKEKESDRDTPIPIKTMEMKLVTAENEQTTQDTTTSKTTAIPVAVIEWTKTDYPMKNTVIDEQTMQAATTSKTTIMPVAVIEWTKTDYPKKNTVIDEQTTQDTTKTTEMNLATAENDQTTQDITTSKTTVMPVAVIEWAKTTYPRKNAGGIINTKERTEQNMETTPIQPVTIEMEIVPVSRSSTKQTDNLPITTGIPPTVNNHLEKTTIPTSSQSYNLIQVPSTTLSSLLDLKTKRSTHASPTPAGLDISNSNDEENEDLKTQNEIEHEQATTPRPIVSSYTKSHSISSASIKTAFGSASQETFSEPDIISTSTESSSTNLMPQKIATEKSATIYTLRSLPHSLNGKLSKATPIDIESTKSPVEITTTEIASESSELNKSNTNKIELITTTASTTTTATASTTTTTNFSYNIQTESTLISSTEPSLETTSTDPTLIYSTREPSTEAVLNKGSFESKTTDTLISTEDIQLKSPNLQEVSTTPTLSNDYRTIYQELGIPPSIVSKINGNLEPQTTLSTSSTMAPSTTLTSSDTVQLSESISKNEEAKTTPAPATVIVSKPLDYQGTSTPQLGTTKYPYNDLFYDYVYNWSKYLEGIQNWINKYMVPVEHHNITLHPDAHPTLNPNGTNYQHEYEEYLNSIERWEAISLVKAKLTTTTTENPDDGDTTTTTAQSFDSITPKFSASYEVSSTVTIPKIVSTEEQASQNIYLNYRTAPRTDLPTFAAKEAATTITTTTTPQPPPTTTTTVTTETATTTSSTTTTAEAPQTASLYITPPNIYEENSQFKVAPLPSSGIIYQGSVYPYQLSGALYIENNPFLLPSINPTSISTSTQSQIEYSDQLVVATTPSAALAEPAVPVAVESTQPPNDLLMNTDFSTAVPYFSTTMPIKEKAENTEMFKTTESSTLSTVGISSGLASNSNANDLSTAVPYIFTTMPAKEEAENAELFKTTESSTLSTAGISSGLVSNSNPNDLSTPVPYISTIMPAKEEAENAELFKTTESSTLSTAGISSGLVSNSNPNDFTPEAVWTVQAPSSTVSELSPYQVETSEHLFATTMPSTLLTETTVPMKESPDDLLINTDLKTALPYISTTLSEKEDAENVKLTTETTKPSLIITQTSTILPGDAESISSAETTLSTGVPYVSALASNPNSNILTNPTTIPPVLKFSSVPEYNLLSTKNEDTSTTTAFPTFSTISTTLTSKTSTDTSYPTEKLVTSSDTINGENVITDFSTTDSTNFVTSPLLVVSQSPIINANLESDSLNLTAMIDDRKATTSSLPTNMPTKAVNLAIENTAEANSSAAPGITSQYKVSYIPKTVKITTIPQSPQDIVNQKKKAQEEEEEQEVQDSQPFTETSSSVSSENIRPRQVTTVSITKSRSLLSTLLTPKRVSLTTAHYIGDEIQGPNAGDLIINADLKSSDPYKNIQEYSLSPTQTTGSDKNVTPVVTGSKITLARLLSTTSPRVASAATITQPNSKNPVFQSLAFQLATNDVVLSKDLEKYPHLESDLVDSYDETPIGNEATEKLTEGYETGPDQFSMKRGDFPESEGSSDENQSKFSTKSDAITQSESKIMNELPVLNEEFPIKENFHSDKIENRIVNERSNNAEPFVSKVESNAVPLVPFNDAINQGFIPENDDGEYRNVPLTARDVIERPIDRQNILDIPAKDNDVDWGKELPIESNYVDRLNLPVNGLAKGNVRSEIPKEHLNPFFKPGEKYINFLKRSYFPRPADPADPDPDASVLPDDADILNKY